MALIDHLRGLLDRIFLVANEVILGVPLTDFSFLPNGMVNCLNNWFLHDTLPFVLIYLYSKDLGMRTSVNALTACA